MAQSRALPRPRPPEARSATLLLVHGAGTGPWVFDGWPEGFHGLPVVAVDLQRGVEVRTASMRSYADALVHVAERLRRPLYVCGWSMGGLVALMAAERLAPRRLVLLEPSPPAEVQGVRPDIELVTGTFDPEAAYGRFPAGIRARRESLLARAERHAGISVPSIPCPALVVYGDQFPDERGRRIAAFYRAETLYFAGLDHWGLVLDPRVRHAVADHLVTGR